MDTANWFMDWAACYGKFPANYLVLDIETTGCEINKDVILQLGWCQIKNQTVKANDGIIFNWAKSPHCDPNWIKQRMITTAKEIKAKGGSYPWKFDDLAQGINPIDGLSVLVDLLCDTKDNCSIFVAHNGIRLDMPMITAHLKRFLKVDFTFGDMEVWDTGAMEKGSQLEEQLYPNETPGRFAFRILTRHDRNVYWSLHDYAMHKYDLIKRYKLDMSKAHTAPFDAYVTHLLLEEYRYMAYG